MSQANTFLDMLVSDLRRASSYNRYDQEPPATILWADREREWESLLPRLRERWPVLTLGPYAPEQASGPAAWVRCMVARTLPNSPPADVAPVLYLPGIGGDNLRDPGERLSELKPLVDLIYRSVSWCHPGGRDWTIAAFLAHPTQGLGAEVRNDADTRKAMQRALIQLADMQVAQLREDAPWRASDFDALIGYHGIRREIDVRELISHGESVELEFKSTARWNVKENRKDAAMEQVIIKTVAGFLNSKDGGTLLIGVRDDGAIHSLDDDYKTWSDKTKQNKDQYELWLVNMLLTAYGRELAPFVKAIFHEVDGKEVCRVTVYPAPKPVFVREKDKNGEMDDVFYVRTGNSTNKLNARAAIEYVRIRWGSS